MKDKKNLRRIEAILTKDENIEKSFALDGCQVYATDKRLLMVKGRTTRDFDYSHISSVAYSSKRYFWLIALGIIFIIAGALVSLFLSEESPVLAGVAIGLIVIIVGILRKSEWVDVNIVGVSESIKFKGERQDLDSLLQIIRQKKVTEHTAGQKEMKDSNFVETIRKLAELRDEGILTQEEFEEKKGKLLRNSD